MYVYAQYFRLTNCKKNIIGIFEITIVYYNLCFGIEMDTLQWWNDELDEYTNKTDK